MSSGSSSMADEPETRGSPPPSNPPPRLPLPTIASPHNDEDEDDENPNSAETETARERPQDTALPLTSPVAHDAPSSAKPEQEPTVNAAQNYAKTTPAAASPSVSPLPPATSTDDIVMLNVGGRTFTTSTATLLWPGDDTFFAALLCNRLPVLRDHSGAIFIDRDPEVFAEVLSFLRTRVVRLRHADALADLRREAEFYGLSGLAQRLLVHESRSACGGLLFEGCVAPISPDDGPIRAITGAHTLVAVAHDHVVTCWRYSEAHTWAVEARSPVLEDEYVTSIALRPRLGAAGEAFVAIGTDRRHVYLWGFAGSQEHRESTSQAAFGARDSGDEEGVEVSLQQYDLTVPPANVLFINNNLVAVAASGKVGVRNARTRLWQVQEVAPIRCHDTAGSMLLLGSNHGKIRLMDFQKFAVRLRDMDLLVNVLFTDPEREAITAISVYESVAAERCMEIAYGTASGTVRVLIQHPETVGQAPLLYQTYTVHRNPISIINLSQHYLISVCKEENHVRSWHVARFRGRISTQPGSRAVASFNVPSATSNPIGPFGDADQTHLIFLQWASPHTDQLLLKSAARGETITVIESVDGSPIVCAYLHEGGMASRVGSRARRFLCTGHENGTTQIWDLTTALEQHRSASAAARDMLLAGDDASNRGPPSDLRVTSMIDGSLNGPPSLSTSSQRRVSLASTLGSSMA